jgi:glucokinase
MLIGVDIGGSKVLVAGSDSRLRLKGTRKQATPASPRAGLELIQALIHQVAGDQAIDAIAVAAPGPLDVRRGTLLRPPNLPWPDLNLAAPLSQAFRVPVTIENDANAAGLAEAALGAGRGYHIVLYVTISTGIGTGVVVGGHIYHGAHDTEGGHITINPQGPPCGCGGRGHFEAVCAGPAIFERFGKHAFEIKDRPTWDLIAADMALGLGSLISLLSPEVVVIGGGVGVHYPRFHQPLKKHLDRYNLLYPPPPVVQAKFVESAAVMGALLLARASLES